jgi:hypothetical protein
MSPTVGCVRHAPFAVVAIVSSEGIDWCRVPAVILDLSPQGDGISKITSARESIGWLRIIRRPWDRARGSPQCIAGPFDRQATIFDVRDAGLVGNPVRLG